MRKLFLGRFFGLTAAGVALAAATLNGAHAQDYPAKPVHIIAPFAAGGSGDVTTRLVADYLGQHNEEVLRDWLGKDAK